MGSCLIELYQVIFAGWNRLDAINSRIFYFVFRNVAAVIFTVVIH